MKDYKEHSVTLGNTYKTNDQKTLILKS